MRQSWGRLTLLYRTKANRLFCGDRGARMCSCDSGAVPSGFEYEALPSRVSSSNNQLNPARLLCTFVRLLLRRCLKE